MARRLPRDDYTVGWVCALPIELAAAKALLDEEHGNTSDNNNNVYCMGSMAGHNVVIVCLPAGRIGNNPATAVATQMQAAFNGIRFGLMVGIGGGVPSGEADIRLGDVVVSHPERTLGGVVQHDLGKSTSRGFERIGSLNAPPQILLSALSTVRANETLGRTTITNHVSAIERIPAFRRLRAGPDVLFEAGYDHIPGPTCNHCSADRQRSRPQRESGAEVTIHYGTIASGNQVIKNATERDRISAELDGVLCFEMEAAGLMDTYPCLVIRGICDYADSHKNKHWQPFAAGAAAAYAKELLTAIPPADVIGTRRVEDAMRSGTKRHLDHSSPVRASSKRSKHDRISSAEDVIIDTDCVLFDGTFEQSSADRNIQRTVTLPFHQQPRNQRPINDEQKRSLVESLRFDQIDARQMTIKSAHAKTCKWLLRSFQYKDWLDINKVDEHHGFLWIKGKAGAGKSTLMKFATANARKTMKEVIILSFFFNARGEDLEKSSIGTYRSLLLQLLEAIPESQSIFDSIGIPPSAVGKDQQWSIELLRTLLEQAIQSLGHASVVCFIDALDECEEEQVRVMIQFLEHIADVAVSNEVHFKVCFSSRHYPHVTIRNGLELVLEGHEGHAQDITNYIETEIKIGKSKAAQRIRTELQEKASGVFMWVVLVVDILNREFDRGQVHALRKKLQEIPGDLHELFRDILTRDSHNKELLVLCIQWVLFARKPLSPDQLYHALLSSVNPDATSDWDPEDVTKDDMKRYILNASKGLTEATTSKDPRIQFIHESVRDFLLKENGLSKIWPEFINNFDGKSHERLKQCCVDYIRIADATTLQVPNDLSKITSQEITDLRNSAAQLVPFLEYAVHNVLYHADAAESSGIFQAGFLANFPIPQWVRFDNLFEKHKVRRHTQNVSLLYLLAEFDMANLVKFLDLASQCLNIEDERYGCALFAAAAVGSEKTLRLCMDSINAQRASNSLVAGTDDQHCQRTSAKRSEKRDFVYSKSKTLLLNAVELVDVELFTLLLRSGKVNVDAKQSEAVLHKIVKNGWAMAVRPLLSASPYSAVSIVVNSKYRYDTSALYLAAEKGNEAMVRVLLDNGADVNMQDGRYGTAILIASARGHKEVAKLLLDRGADINLQGGNYGNALQAAAVDGHKDVVELLLDRGANINLQGGYYGNALYAAAVNRHKDVVELLLDRGADINLQGGNYGNALQAAAVDGHKDVIELLLDRGVDINLQGGNYGNALQAAAVYGHKDVVELLLDRGADINLQGGNYGNALQAAAVDGHKDVIELLLDRGADINLRGGNYGNALRAAAVNGHKDVVELLLDRGADINLQGGNYGSALQAAALANHKDVVELLLDRGADINLQGGNYGNALQAASRSGHKDIVMLLLEKGAHVNAQGGEYVSAL